MLFRLKSDSYFAIIGDIKRSKELKERNVIQKRMNSILEEINEEYAEYIAARFLITLGDEFQGLLKNGDMVFPIIKKIQRKMDPITLRFGIGIGEINTEINPEMALGADGPGFYMARKAIDILKAEEHKYEAYVPEIKIEVDGEEEGSKLLNTVISLMELVEKRWTARQREIILDTMDHQDGQKATAKRLQITQSSVQRALAGGSYYAYREAENTLNSILSKMKVEK